ncbi:hypothetical protein HPP92_006887 [Vanilla planifolia]|uniref:Uncharacterized protein n=1 Tax=Vanilla planifolia TaxID=51239 RepID=A0A835RF81_VANPL|nr:hypothetical protein HPP92_007121 [Vanilla planifolia]KAG0490024.1 hypothetical protein HPP92_006887 [Vanilla planifolia]
MPARASQCTDEKDTSSRAKYRGVPTARCIVQRRRSYARWSMRQTSAHPDKR